MDMEMMVSMSTGDDAVHYGTAEKKPQDAEHDPEKDQ